jgi:arylsulfatase A-like enzyme
MLMVTQRQVTSVFGMNFQAVSVGQKLVEKSKGLTGGYLDVAGTPSPSLMNEIQYVDNSIGEMVTALQGAGIADSTLIIVSAKHGQSPIDPNRVSRIPADDSTKMAPSDILAGLGTGLIGGGLVGQADEDDVSMLWLTDPTMIASAVAILQKNENVYGGGEIFVGPALNQLFNSPSIDSRTPDIIIAPNVGVTFTGGKAKVSEHGGFSNDDRNVILLVSNSRISAATFTSQVETRQVAPTILQALGINQACSNPCYRRRRRPCPGWIISWGGAGRNRLR